MHSFDMRAWLLLPQAEVDGDGEAAEAPERRYDSTSGAGAPAPLAPALVTLSLLPRSQWHNLVHLDAIKARSKPVQPPKKPEAAPFFLPTVAGASYTYSCSGFSLIQRCSRKSSRRPNPSSRPPSFYLTAGFPVWPFCIFLAAEVQPQG